jgi:hypothetical protein
MVAFAGLSWPGFAACSVTPVTRTVYTPGPRRRAAEELRRHQELDSASRHPDLVREEVQIVDVFLRVALQGLEFLLRDLALLRAQVALEDPVEVHLEHRARGLGPRRQHDALVPRELAIDRHPAARQGVGLLTRDAILVHRCRY